MAVLAAFVYDPLINWRLLSKAPSPKASRKGKVLISKSDDSYDEDSFESYEEVFYFFLRLFLQILTHNYRASRKV